MNIEKILNDKKVKSKEKIETISKMLLDKKISLNELIRFAKISKDPVKATCIEAIEFATKNKPKIASSACLEFVSQTLSEKAPRVKWESAKVIGNITRLYPNGLDEAIKNLMINANHSGTVVRWSAAFALGEIIKMKTAKNKYLIPKIEFICKREEKNSIKKIYLEALKKAKQ
ncbi:MAG: hypothetical protein HYV53_02480 [Parcubacteria group bacterium]|nr:hypothetical protein [Parcubacteria group bacterium]